jgi:hypothetical protein
MSAERRADPKPAQPSSLLLLVCLGICVVAIACSMSWKNAAGLCIGVGAGCLACGVVLFLDWRRAARTPSDPVRPLAAPRPG